MPLLKLTNRWAVLAILFFVRSAVGFQFLSLPPISPLIIDDLDLSFTQLGLLIGLFMLPGAAVALPSGLLAQRVGDRFVVALGLGLMLIGSEVIAASWSFKSALVGRLICGAGAVLVIVQLAKVVTDLFLGKELATAMAFLLTSWHVGIAAALGMLGGIATTFSWRTSMHAVSALTLIVLAVFLFSYHEQPQPRRETHSPPLWTITSREFALISAAGMVWMIWNVGFVVFLGFAPLLLVDRGAPLGHAGFITSLPSWLSMASGPVGGYLIDRTGKSILLITVAILGSAVFMGLLPTGPTLALIILLGVVRGPCAGGVNALAGEVLSRKSRSMGMGIYYTIFYLGMATLPPVAGYLQDLAGNSAAPLIFAACLTGLTIVPLAFFRMMQRRWL